MAFVCAAVAATALIAVGAPRPWRLLLFVPLSIGALCVFEVRSSTCVVLAALGLRDLDDGAERIEQSAELTQLMRQSRSVHIRALLLSSGLTVALYVM